MQTLKLGSAGGDVAEWQRFLAIPADGKFGQGTQSATIAWQRSHRLAADGVVGPISWATAKGEPVKIAKTASATTDDKAYQTMRRAVPNATEPEVQYALTVARGEGFYGLGWRGEGVGSNNWGAVQGAGDAGSFSNTDHHADGKSYIGKFKRYSTPEAGAADMFRILMKQNVRNYVNAGRLKKAVFAQHDNGYYELHPAKYYTAVKKNYGTLTANLEWKKLLTRWYQPFFKVFGLVK